MLPTLRPNKTPLFSVSIAIPTEEESALTMQTARENATLEGRSDIKIKVVNEKVVLIADSMARHVNIKGVLTFYTPGGKISDVTRNIHLYRLEDATHLLIWIGSNNLDSEQGVAGCRGSI